jgi:hypothetical protein
MGTSLHDKSQALACEYIAGMGLAALAGLGAQLTLAGRRP